MDSAEFEAHFVPKIRSERLVVRHPVAVKWPVAGLDQDAVGLRAENGKQRNRHAAKTRNAKTHQICVCVYEFDEYVCDIKVNMYVRMCVCVCI